MMTSPNNWHIVENVFPQAMINHKETVFTIGNGFLSTRGTFEEGYPGEVPTTFVHGVFNDVPTFGTELVNFPNPFSLSIQFDGELVRMDEGKILDYQRVLSLESGLLTRRVVWESPNGRRATLEFERFLDMEAVHHAGLRLRISEIDFSGRIQIRADLIGVVSNENYRHWTHVGQGRVGLNGCYLALETSDSQITACLAERFNLDFNGEFRVEYWDAQWTPTLVYTCDVSPGDEIIGTKHVMVYTSREDPEPIVNACQGADEISKLGFDASLAASCAVWKDLWARSNVVIEGDDVADQALRYNLFQILIAAPRHDDTVSIAAKTLSGYGYRGHVFWDTEIFILPFLIYTQPDIARNLLMYRYHTLPGARQKARKNGLQGAMFAWESAATGEEVTPKWVVGPEGELIKIWCGEIEQHITADVVYGIRQYWQATGDDVFMRDYGAEIILSAGQFYASRLEPDESQDAYHIRDVIGPDEYHEHVDDNAMTNLMASWVLEYANQIAEWMQAHWPAEFTSMMQKMNLKHDEIRSWPEMAAKIVINTREDGVIEQFDGFFDLTFLDQAGLEPRRQSLQSLFGIEGVQQYQFIKQPDVVMAMHLLEDQFENEQVLANMDYYTPRTDLSFGSSLGPSIQALMLARLGQVTDAKRLFIKTLLTDLENNRGNTPEGIHAASAGAVWQVVVMGFGGFRVEDGAPVFKQNFPEEWQRVRFNILWQGKILGFDNSL